MEAKKRKVKRRYQNELLSECMRVPVALGAEELGHHRRSQDDLLE